MTEALNDTPDYHHVWTVNSNGALQLNPAADDTWLKKTESEIFLGNLSKIEREVFSDSVSKTAILAIDLWKK